MNETNIVEELPIKFINYDEIWKYVNVNYELYKKKNDYINKIISEINNSLLTLNNKKTVNKSYRKYYKKLIELLEEFKPSNVFGASGRFILEKIAKLEFNFANFDANKVKENLEKLKKLIIDAKELIASRKVESDARFKQFSIDIDEYNKILTDYNKIVNINDSVTYKIKTFLSINKYTKDQIIEFNAIKNEYNSILESIKVFKSLYNLTDLANKIAQIKKKWLFDEKNLGIFAFHSDKDTLNEIENLLQKVEFTNIYSNDYNNILDEYNAINKLYYNIVEQYSKENLNKNIRTEFNINILNRVQKLNISIIENNYIALRNEIKIIEDKIEKQSKGILSFLKKGKGNEKLNIINVIFIGILLIVIFIIEFFKKHIAQSVLHYLSIISALLGSCIIIYGLNNLRIEINNNKM